MGRFIMTELRDIVRVFAIGLGLLALLSGGMRQTNPADEWKGAPSFASGGIGRDQAAGFKKPSVSYALAVEFIRPVEDKHGADIAVTIKRGDGKTVLDVQAEGPFLLVNLPDGAYTVHALKDGKPMQRAVNINRDGRQRVVFEWK
jgi:hypothetical protein